MPIKSWSLQPGAKLPPNEIFGRDWPLALVWIAFALAQLLGIVPLIFVVVRLVKDSPRRHVGEKTEMESCNVREK
jgi:hypothetical protein